MADSSASSEWCDIFFREFGKETDRAAVILSAAMLEQSLETLLRAYLVPVSGSDDSLFDGAYAPVSSFSAKIDLAYRVGVISTTFCRDLHLIRRIRNEFAHNIEQCSFANAAVKSRMVELKRSSAVLGHIEWDVTRFPPEARGEFAAIVSWMLWYLASRVQRITAIRPASLEWGYDEAFLQRMDKPEEDGGQSGTVVT